VLIHEYPARTETPEALRGACKDLDVEIRIRAALALGVDGRPTLVELARSGPDVYAARAVGILDRHLSPESCTSILEDALRTRRTETARACLGMLGRMGGPGSVPLAAKVMRREQGELAAAAALGAIGVPAAEQSLIAALRWPGTVRVAAAEALGRFGSIHAVQPLTEAEREPRPDEGFRRAARTAIAQIQARATGASPGQLSLAPEGAGQLSLAGEDETGRLSLPSEPVNIKRPPG
jgi:HEAT repeat protein